MSNGYLCVGGTADGQYHTLPNTVQHDQRIRIAPRLNMPFSAFEPFAGPSTTIVEEYKAFHWHQGRYGTMEQRTRYYLIPLHWDGFDALDHLERKAYGDERR